MRYIVLGSDSKLGISRGAERLGIKIQERSWEDLTIAVKGGIERVGDAWQVLNAVFESLDLQNAPCLSQKAMTTGLAGWASTSSR
jgi:hypothetical protein